MHTQSKKGKMFSSSSSHFFCRCCCRLVGNRRQYIHTYGTHVYSLQKWVLGKKQLDRRTSKAYEKSHLVRMWFFSFSVQQYYSISVVLIVFLCVCLYGVDFTCLLLVAYHATGPCQKMHTKKWCTLHQETKCMSTDIIFGVIRSLRVSIRENPQKHAYTYDAIMTNRTKLEPISVHSVADFHSSTHSINFSNRSYLIFRIGHIHTRIDRSVHLTSSFRLFVCLFCWCPLSKCTEWDNSKIKL